jgi:Concanavalin A-like lectin/glucanases superfamily
MTVGMGPAFWQIRDEGDPYADDVIAHLWFDGDIVDRSQFAATYSYGYGATLSASPVIFAAGTSLDTTYVSPGVTYAAYISGGGAHISPGNYEFTVEFWYYELGSPAPGNQYHFFFYNHANGHNFRIFSPGFKGNIAFDVAGGPASGTSSVSVGWHHIALTRLGNNYDLWIDGGLAQSVTNSTMDTGTHNSGSYNVWIGAGSSYGSAYASYYSNFRFTKKCRYTAAFPVPTAQFPDPVP